MQSLHSLSEFFVEVLPNSCLTPALMAIVIGHWAQDGELHPDSHCSGRHHNVFVYQSKEGLLKEIIATFTFDSQTVIDGIEDSGINNLHTHLLQTLLNVKC